MFFPRTLFSLSKKTPLTIFPRRARAAVDTEFVSMLNIILSLSRKHAATRSALLLFFSALSGDPPGCLKHKITIRMIRDSVNPL